MNESKLKPCPFCGFDRPYIQGNGIGDYYVICDDEHDMDAGEGCLARTSDHYCESKEQAAERWNRRPPTKKKGRK